MKLSPYARIVRNARRGVGVRLSAAEVAELALDDAINTVGRADLGEFEDRSNWKPDPKG